VTNIYDHHLATHNVSVGQYSLLAKIGKAGTIGFIPLAALMGMDRSTLSRTLKPLVQAGWVETGEQTLESPCDKRSFVVQLTEQGVQKCSQCRPDWLKAQRRIDTLLGKGQHQQLFAILDQANKNLENEGGDYE
jgi:DNA-binding MarR family transcriptional regulator